MSSSHVPLFALEERENDDHPVDAKRPRLSIEEDDHPIDADEWWSAKDRTIVSEALEDVEHNGQALSRSHKETTHRVMRQVISSCRGKPVDPNSNPMIEDAAYLSHGFFYRVLHSIALRLKIGTIMLVPEEKVVALNVGESGDIRLFIGRIMCMISDETILRFGGSSFLPSVFERDDMVFLVNAFVAHILDKLEKGDEKILRAVLEHLCIRVARRFTDGASRRTLVALGIQGGIVKWFYKKHDILDSGICAYLKSLLKRLKLDALHRAVDDFPLKEPVSLTQPDRCACPTLWRCASAEIDASLFVNEHFDLFTRTVSSNAYVDEQ